MADISPVIQLAPVLGAVAKGEIVTIFLGPDKKRYSIHKDIICHYSEYFRAAYNGRWKESTESVTLEDVEVEVFNLFVHWLYTQELPKERNAILGIADSGMDVVRMSEYSTDSHCRLLLLKSSVFGDRFLASGFRHLAHNACVNRHFLRDGKSCFGAYYTTIIWAFKNLPPESSIRALVTDLQCHAWDPEYDEEEEQELLPELPHEFLVAVMQGQGKLKTLDIEKKRINACSYHLHESEEEKKACPFMSKKK